MTKNKIMLSIYNSLTKRKDIFIPLDPKNVRMYVCGMTVYDLCHLGHARVLVVFDTIYRYLRAIYGEDHVTYVRNITDIDDKIIARMQQRNEDLSTLTEHFIHEMNTDADALGVLRPDREPRATEHIKQIVEMINTLLKKEYAYTATNGDVYYAVRRFSNYGHLSGKKLADLRAGERVEINKAKRDPLDFVLWKASKPNEPAWESPWGKGRPGWHIECSAMSTHCLGASFDIHGGGLDLQFPHHENEIAQSEGATSKKFVNLWIHNGFVRVDDEKMSKSLGNFFTVRELLKKYKPEVIRYFILNSHYRSPLNYSQENLNSAKAAVDGFYTALRDIDCEFDEKHPTVVKFDTALCDDFNTPVAIALLANLKHDLNIAKQAGVGKSDTHMAKQLAGVMKYLGGFLGILQDNPEKYLQTELSIIDQVNENTDTENNTNEKQILLSSNEIELLIEQRRSARANKDWAEADRIRNKLKLQGVVLEDKNNKTRWRRV